MWALCLHRVNTSRYEQIVIYGFLTARNVLVAFLFPQRQFAPGTFSVRIASSNNEAIYLNRLQYN